MPIKRISEQGRMTIEEFYLDMATGKYRSIDIENGNAMLQLIEVINQLFLKTTIWCLTSHDCLCLIADNNSESDMFITIERYSSYYDLYYFLPKENRPWKNARVNGAVRTLEEAKKYLLIAMRESGGWSTNEELKQLLKDNLLT